MSQYNRSHSTESGALHRCFYAVQFPGEITSYLASIIEQLKRHRADVRWVPARNIHLTLRFLGEITSSQLEQAMNPGEDMLPIRLVRLRASGLGAFPLLRAPRVFWAGVEGGSQEDMDRLLHLQGRTEQWSQKLGLEPERRRYAPHITLGRIGRPSDGLKELTDDIIGRECLSPYCSIESIVLMRSTLTRAGSIYEVVRRWELAQ